MKKIEKQATCSEICDYIRDNVKEGDIVRISIGMAYIPGEVILNNDCVLHIKLESKMFSDLTTTVDVEKFKEELIELEHETEDGIYVFEAIED